MPTRADTQARTRALLLRAANRLFLRDGYVATSLATIAAEAGVTKGAVYSNFESKEDLFLAVLAELTQPDWAAPTDVDSGAVEGADAHERARNFGRQSAGERPSRRQVALFLEMNASALRSERARRWVASHNDRFFEVMGLRLRDALGTPGADPVLLGVVAQSLYAGLMMHRAFSDHIDDEVFAVAYEALVAVAERSVEIPTVSG
jgi:AcrR family transcriptional regulator